MLGKLDYKRAAKVVLEGLRVAMATLIVYFVILMAYYIVVRQPDQIVAPASVMWLGKAFALALAYNVLYQYMGFDKSDKTIRRITLEKDELRCLTLINEEYARIPASTRTAPVRTNMAILRAAAINGEFMAEIAEAGHCAAVDDTDINDEQRQILCELPEATLRAIPRILGPMDRDVIYDVLLNGFGRYEDADEIDSGPAKKLSLTQLERDAATISDTDALIQYDGRAALAARIADLRSENN